MRSGLVRDSVELRFAGPILGSREQCSYRPLLYICSSVGVWCWLAWLASSVLARPLAPLSLGVSLGTVLSKASCSGSGLWAGLCLGVVVAPLVWVGVR